MTTYSTFRTHFDHVVARSPIVLTPTPERIPAPSDAALAEEARGRLSVPSVADIAPSLADAGPSLFPGGEGEALRRLDAHLARDGGAWAGAFEKPKTSPTEIDPFGAGTRSTTVLSAYLKFGCLSPRTFWVRLRDATKGARTRSAPPVSLDGQLLWREFYYACAHAVGPAFGQMEDNPICRQIGWRVPADDPAAAEALAAWRDGRTGYPWIDACMRQLKSEGWMHHLARHAVACFLTRGDLYVRWEEGAAVFDELLIDADWAVNNGNWMWLSCSCFFYQARAVARARAACALAALARPPPRAHAPTADAAACGQTRASASPPSAVLPLLLARRIRAQVRPGRRLRPEVCPGARPLSEKVHLRAVARADRRPE